VTSSLQSAGSHYNSRSTRDQTSTDTALGPELGADQPSEGSGNRQQSLADQLDGR